jgi:hypothetical protein
MTQEYFGFRFLHLGSDTFCAARVWFSFMNYECDSEEEILLPA